MATQTPNLNLKKPAGTDYVLVGDFNGNADALDATIGKMSELTTAVKTSLVLAINDANNRGTHPPYIGENNHWYEWDSATTQYVDSGVVAEGADGNDGISAYVHIKWSATQPTSDSDMKATPDAYIGIYSGTSATAPTAYTSYSWYQYKGAKGDTGTAGTGNNWYSGNAITGTSTTPTAYSTGIALAQVGDMYMNTGALPDTGRVYKCTLGGNASTALWKYDVLLRGADGQGSGDMLKSVYDTNNDGVVNDSDKLGGVAASGYAKEISGQTDKGSYELADYIPIADSAAGNAQKKVSGSAILGRLIASPMPLSASGTRANLALLDSMLTAFGKLMKWYTDFATVVFTGSYTDLLNKPVAGTDFAAVNHNHDSAYAPKITVSTNTSATTISITTAADKTVYRYTQNITALTISNNPATAPWAYRVEFTAGGNFTPSFPAGITWNGGTAPTMKSGKKYSLIIASHISSYAEA